VRESERSYKREGRREAIREREARRERGERERERGEGRREGGNREKGREGGREGGRDRESERARERARERERERERVRERERESESRRRQGTYGGERHARAQRRRHAADLHPGRRGGESGGGGIGERPRVEREAVPGRQPRHVPALLRRLGPEPVVKVDHLQAQRPVPPAALRARASGDWGSLGPGRVGGGRCAGSWPFAVGGG
jgi:hypothetical protein